MKSKSQQKLIYDSLDKIKNDIENEFINYGLKSENF